MESNLAPPPTPFPNTCTHYTHTRTPSRTHYPATSSSNGDACVPLLREADDDDEEENAVSSLVNTNTKLTAAIAQQQKQFNTANNNK